jgi:hypothetical protein
MNTPRHHIPDVVKERIRQIGRVKIYKHSTANKPSFIQWMDNKSSLKWTLPGSRKRCTEALSQQIKSQLQHDFQQNDDSYADGGIWRSEALSAVILAQLSKLLLALGRGYVSPDAWKAWSRLPDWSPLGTPLSSETRFSSLFQDRESAEPESENPLPSTPKDVLGTLEELRSCHTVELPHSESPGSEPPGSGLPVEPERTTQPAKKGYNWWREPVNKISKKSSFAFGRAGRARKNKQGKSSITEDGPEAATKPTGPKTRKRSRKDPVEGDGAATEPTGPKTRKRSRKDPVEGDGPETTAHDNIQPLVQETVDEYLVRLHSLVPEFGRYFSRKHFSLQQQSNH